LQYKKNKKTLKVNHLGFKNITVSELQTWIQNSEEFFLIDVREQYEREICDIGGKLMNFHAIMNNLDAIPRTIPVVLYCHYGERSYFIAQILSQMHNFNNIYNLLHGINAWATEIDSSMPKY